MFFTYQTLAAEETKELTDLLYNFNTKRKSKAGSFRYLARELSIFVMGVHNR